MKNQRFLSALAATVMAVSLFTCTALAANEPADTVTSLPALEASCSLSVFAPSVLAHCT